LASYAPVSTTKKIAQHPGFILEVAVLDPTDIAVVRTEGAFFEIRQTAERY
jgi:hypothetical protein